MRLALDKSIPLPMAESVEGLAYDGAGRLLVLTGPELLTLGQDGEVIAQRTLTKLGRSLAWADGGVWIGRRGGVDRFDAEGRLVASLDDPDRLGIVTGVAVAGERVAVADATGRALRLYDRLAWRRDMGVAQNRLGFMIPNGVLTVAYDPKGPSFVVAHPQKHRVERYTLDGEFISKFGKFGHDAPEDFGGCCNPTTIATASDGTLFLSEKAPPVVKAFTAGGEYLAMTPDDAFFPGAKNQRIAVADDGRVAASDSDAGVVRVFRLVEESSPQG